MSYLQVNDIVHSMLKLHPLMRDNDYKLVVAVWNKELLQNNINIREITAYDAFVHIANGKVSPVESITRCRRKLQENYPALRGKRWAERHDALEGEVKAELGYEGGNL